MKQELKRKKNGPAYCYELFGKLVTSKMNHINGQERFELMNEIINLIWKEQIIK